jgi:hypothetical protein
MSETTPTEISGNAEMQAGPQPLAELLSKHEIKPHDLVAASTEHLNHKQVTKGCKGRKLTRNMQDKILRALNTCTEEAYTRTDLFNYRGH